MNQDQAAPEKNDGNDVNKDGSALPVEKRNQNSDDAIQVINKIHRTPPNAGHRSRKISTDNVSKSSRSQSRSQSVSSRGRSSSTSKSNTKRKREGNEPVCGVCKKEFIKGKEDCVECDLCFRWFHGPTCVNLSKKEIAAITLLGDKICWYCLDCSVGASTLHKQTKLLNDAIGKLDSEVSLLKSQQSANLQTLTIANQNIAKNYNDIKSNSTRISTAKQDIVVLQTNQQVNTTKINTLNTKVDTITKSMKEDISNQIDIKVKDEVIAETIKNEVKTQTQTIEANLLAKLEAQLNLTVEEKMNKDENPTPVNTDDIKKAVDEKFNEIYNAEFPTVPQQVNSINTENINSRTIYPTRFTKAVQEEIAEREEILKRKNQLIVMNVKESKSEDEDRIKLKGLFDLLKLNKEIVVTEAIRLGEKRRDNKPRFLRVTLADLGMKREILANATKLRDVPEGNEYYKVFIKPNLTAKQNEVSKNLQVELRERRLKDTSKKYKISKGKIIEVPTNQQ